MIPFDFVPYKKEIEDIRPDAVILFLHLRDRIIWPLLAWLKMKRIPVIFWTKGLNLDAPNDRVSLALYRFMHRSVDRMILYSENERKFIRRNTGTGLGRKQYDQLRGFSGNQAIERGNQEGIGIPYDKVVLVGRKDGRGESGKRSGTWWKSSGISGGTGLDLVIVAPAWRRKCGKG